MGTIEIITESYRISSLFFLLLIGGVISMITFFFLLRYRNTPGVKYWLVLQTAVAVWSITYAFEFAATHIETKILWSKLSYFGIVYCSVSFLFFALSFTSQYRFLKKQYTIALYALATLFILSPFTNELHHLHWKSYSIAPTTNATNYEYGPLFWSFMVFSYSTLVIGIIQIVLFYFRLSSYYRTQTRVLFIASLLPPFGNIIYVFHINPIPGFDWTPFSFLLTGILIAYNISQFKMFELVPFARTKLFDIIPDAILILDNFDRIADLNPAMKKLLRKPDKNLLGKNVEDAFPHHNQLFNEIRNKLEFETEIEQDFDGEKRYFDLQAVTLIDQKKHQTGRLIVLKDITHHVAAEEKILNTNSRLIDEIKEREKLIADLDAFSHTVAHDLKNMLGAIVTASTLIQNGIDEMPKEELLELNDLIGQSATKTMHITRELLTLASVRQQDVKPTSVNMKKVVAEALKRLDDMIQESGAQISLPDEWPVAMGYESWLEEVWTNYISNAIKYGGTPPIIKLGAEKLASGQVKFWITDNGKGLSEEQIALLFNKFTRLETLRAEGHGLGLSIVKRIIEKLNGQVGVESRHVPGEGSIFYFLLPAIDKPSDENKSM